MKNETFKEPSKPVLIALSDGDLTNPVIIQLLAIICFSIQFGKKYLSRRSFANWAADVWRDYDGDVLNQDGTPYVLPDIDELLGGGEDGDFPWMRTFFSWALEFEGQEFYRGSIERLRFIDLTIKAAGPLGWRNKRG